MKNKGITLVALVITIIILLILAGITISQLTGSGLFENAKLAKEKSENAQEKEDETLADYENKIGEYVGGSRDYEPVIYKSQIFSQSPEAVISGNISELSLTLDSGTYLVGFEGYAERVLSNGTSVYLPLICTNSNINRFLGTGIIVELEERDTLTFGTGTDLKSRLNNVCTYAIKLK